MQAFTVATSSTVATTTTTTTIPTSIPSPATKYTIKSSTPGLKRLIEKSLRTSNPANDILAQFAYSTISLPVPTALQVNTMLRYVNDTAHFVSTEVIVPPAGEARTESVLREIGKELGVDVDGPIATTTTATASRVPLPSSLTRDHSSSEFLTGFFKPLPETTTIQQLTSPIVSRCPSMQSVAEYADTAGQTITDFGASVGLKSPVGGMITGLAGTAITTAARLVRGTPGMWRSFEIVTQRGFTTDVRTIILPLEANNSSVMDALLQDAFETDEPVIDYFYVFADPDLPPTRSPETFSGLPEGKLRVFFRSDLLSLRRMDNRFVPPVDVFSNALRNASPPETVSILDAYGRLVRSVLAPEAQAWSEAESGRKILEATNKEAEASRKAAEAERRAADAEKRARQSADRVLEEVKKAQEKLREADRHKEALVQRERETAEEKLRESDRHNEALVQREREMAEEKLRESDRHKEALVQREREMAEEKLRESDRQKEELVQREREMAQERLRESDHHKLLLQLTLDLLRSGTSPETIVEVVERRMAA